MERISESLAGRAAYLRLGPLTRRERLGLGRTGIWSELLAASVKDWQAIVEAQDVSPADWAAKTAVGGLPVPAHQLATAEARALWFDGYIDTYLERDLRALSSIENLGDFRRMVRAAAHRVGGVLGDVGLARHLAGGSASGAHLENLVLGDLLAWRELVTPRPSVLYWRTVNQEEVDFVIESGSTLLPVEVKATSRPSHRNARHLLALHAQDRERVRGGLVLHTAQETFGLAEGILAAPWRRVL
jgi:predicted AAA+ superfamily ATPase